MKGQNRLHNDLVRYRERMGFTPNQVAAILGHRKTALVSKLEQGRQTPTLLTALKLAILYRIPVDFLYQKLYRKLREEIRLKEITLFASGQQKATLKKEANVDPR
jgi:DNA-binding XRE family transcriptional regulator